MSERDDLDVFNRRARVFRMKRLKELKRILRATEQIREDVRLNFAIIRRIPGRILILMLMV